MSRAQEMEAQDEALSADITPVQTPIGGSFDFVLSWLLAPCYHDMSDAYTSCINIA